MGRQKHRGRKRYWEQVRELADEHGWSVPEARAQWGRFYKRGGKKRKNPQPAPIDPQVIIDAAPEEGPVCPYCRVGFLADERTSVCQGCQTRLHQECRYELGRCTTLGCRGRSTAGAAQETRPITITIERDQLPSRWRPHLPTVLALAGVTVGAIPLVIWLVIWIKFLIWG